MQHQFNLVQVNLNLCNWNLITTSSTGIKTEDLETKTMCCIEQLEKHKICDQES